MRAGPYKSYVAEVVDADGATHRYVSFARRRSDAEKRAREAVEKRGAKLVAMKASDSPPKRETRLRPRFVVAGTLAITAMMVVREGLAGTF
jgi:hypothetical protein